LEAELVFVAVEPNNRPIDLVLEHKRAVVEAEEVAVVVVAVEPMGREFAVCVV
jgi:hypothetical protein